MIDGDDDNSQYVCVAVSYPIIDYNDDGCPAYSHHDKNPPWWEFISNE